MKKILFVLIQITLVTKAFAFNSGFSAINPWPTADACTPAEFTHPSNPALDNDPNSVTASIIVNFRASVECDIAQVGTLVTGGIQITTKNCTLNQPLEYNPAASPSLLAGLMENETRILNDPNLSNPNDGNDLLVVYTKPQILQLPGWGSMFPDLTCAKAIALSAQEQNKRVKLLYESIEGDGAADAYLTFMQILD